MSKTPDLSDITNIYTSPDVHNANNDELIEAFTNTLSRDGATPNNMGADLDMNSNDILNANSVKTTTLVLDGTVVTPDTSLIPDDAEEVGYLHGGNGAQVRTVGDRLQDLLSVKDFGATGDGVTDDTSAIQSAINSASNNGGMEVYFPAGVYVYTNLYLHYDGTNNATFNSTSTEQGRIRLRGAGRMSYGSYLAGHERGTVLKSSSSTGEATIYGLDGQAVRVENMSVIVDNTTLAIKLDSCPQYSGISELLVVQEGSGGGVELKDMWNQYSQWCFIEGAGKDVSTGIGLYVYNEDQGSGFVTLDTINVNGFDRSVVIGHEERSLAARMHSVEARNVQGGEANVGVTVGGGVSTSNLNFHVEENVLGLRIINNVKITKFKVTTSGNTNDVVVGSSVSGENYYDNIELWLDCSSLSADPQVYVNTGLNCDSVRFMSCKFQGDTTNTAISLEDGVHPGLEVVNPTFNNIGTEIDLPLRVTRYTDVEGTTWRTGNTGGTLTDPSFTFLADSTTGTQAPVKLYQRDNDAPFLQIESETTPTTNSNHISTQNSGTATGPGDAAWTFSRMVKIQIKDATGTTDYWMPLFTKI